MIELPKYWKVQRTLMNHKVLNEWANKNLDYLGLHTGTMGFLYNCNNFNYTYTEISYEDFCKYVLKKEEKWEPSYGEEVEVSSGFNWFKRIFIGINPCNSNFKYVVADPSNKGGVAKWPNIRQISKEITVTKQEIADWKGVPVDQIKIIP